MQYYTFPKNRQDKYKARIKFQPIEITPVQDNLKDLSGINEDSIFAKIGKGFRNTFDPFRSTADQLEDIEGVEVENLSQEDFDELFAESDAAIKAANKKRAIQIKRISEFCYLYVPVSLQFTDSVNLNTANLGISGAAALAGIRGGANIKQAAGVAIRDATTSIFKALGGLNSDAAGLAAQRAANRFVPFVGQQVSDAVQLATQVTVNPVQRTSFGSVNIRSFAFAFKFVPLSREESIEIENIIHWFRKELYPKQIVFGNNIPIGYKFPNLFDIRVQYGGTKEFPRYRTIPNMEILPCYLSAIQHNYNASSMTFHQGGKPTEVDMSLTFTEYRPLSKGDVISAKKVGNQSFYSEEGLKGIW